MWAAQERHLQAHGPSSAMGGSKGHRLNISEQKAFLSIDLKPPFIHLSLNIPPQPPPHHPWTVTGLQLPRSSSGLAKVYHSRLCFPKDLRGQVKDVQGSSSRYLITGMTWAPTNQSRVSHPRYLHFESLLLISFKLQGHHSVRGSSCPLTSWCGSPPPVYSLSP